jgi:hypothetical protein
LAALNAVFPIGIKEEWSANLPRPPLARSGSKVDAQTVLVEGKSTAELSDDEIAQLALASQRINPVVVIACMEEAIDSFRRDIQKLQAAVPSEVQARRVFPCRASIGERRQIVLIQSI